MTVPPWLRGAWQRTLLRTDAADDTSTFVRYVQSETLFVDVRIPAARPRALAGRPLAALDDVALLALAAQQGFAGHATVDGRVCTWHRVLDYQPPSPVPDVGRCDEEAPGRLLEHGIHARYVERWERLDGGGPFLALERAGPPREIVVVAGDHFAHARDRGEPLPDDAASLAAACTAASRAARLAWLDCALSYGRRRAAVAPWTIERSTVPALEGTLLFRPGALEPDGADAGLVIEHRPDGTRRTWHVRDGTPAVARRLTT